MGADDAGADAAGGPSGLSTRLAFWTFTAYLAVAWVLLVFGFGSDRWFYRDDWNFLALRDGGSWAGLLEAHGEHLSLLPVAVYRVLFNVFGLWFLPYLVLIVTLHLGVVALLRTVMRRAGVHPWVATLVAGSLALFGAGEENIQWAFQIGFVGSILFGLVQVLLLDHDGPIGRRDLVALLAGGLAIASSGVGPLMVVAAGGATVVRRGWRVAAVATVPLAALYLAWQVWADPRENLMGNPPWDQLQAWVTTGVTGVFEGLGQHPVAAVGLAALLVGGLWLAWSPLPWVTWRRVAGPPLAFLACLPAFFAVVAQGRWYFGVDFAGSSRYVYVGACFLLPALAVAADAWVRRWRWSAPIVVLLLVAGIPGNIDAFGSSVFGPAYFREERETILGIAHSPLLDQVPGWVVFQPDDLRGPPLTSGWIREARDDGRVPDPGPLTPGRDSQFALRLGLAHVDGELEAPCQELTEPQLLRLTQGDRIRLGTPVLASLDQPPGTPILRVPFSPADGGSVLEVVLPTLDVWLSRTWGYSTYEVCR